MQSVTLVTGNKGKLAEWQRLVPNDFPLESAAVDLPEIQSLDLEAITADKARRAYELIQKPVIVEDISAGLLRLGGLPGPFIKFFEEALGVDALFQLAKQEGEAAMVSCLLCYYDGDRTVSVRADVTGKVVAARGENGFGFDKCFVIDGQSKTFAEMTGAEKDRVSHRAQAIKKLVAELNQL